MSGVDLSDYIEVSERIEMFYKEHPEGSLRCVSWDIREVDGQTFFVYHAAAYRTAEDSAPGEGLAWEPVPGKTPYTKDSEAMNAETSAWGRAIVALGISANRGIASANEVRNRSGNGTTDKASDGQIKFLFGDGQRPGLFAQGGFSNEEIDKFLAFKKVSREDLSKKVASKMIEALKGGDDAPKDQPAQTVARWREEMA